MMAVEISPETNVTMEVPIPIRLPKWLWTVLYARAKALRGGDLECCVNQLLQIGIQTEIKIMGAVGPAERN
ncbi:MAG: hypothetical protein ACLPT6_09385 [Desulfobaccales bacterium]